MYRNLNFGFLFALCTTASVAAGLNIEFDYQYDSRGFFDNLVRREMLKTAADIVNRYVDNLAAIEPEGDNDWNGLLSKPDGSGDLFLSMMPIPQDTLIIYPAGRILSPGTLAHSIELGGVGSGTPEFTELVDTRGQTGAKASPATEFGPIGGTISFNDDVEDVEWHFGLSTRRLEPHEFDFITVAAHEIIHLLGLGTAKSWRDQTNFSNEFLGPHAVEVGSTSNPRLKLDAGEAHWRRITTSTWNGTRQEALLAPAIAPGHRQFPTLLDRAALKDIGWEEATAGDANLDRKFDSTDLVVMFTADKYESNAFAFWAQGDFNDDALFSSRDLIDALATGTYSTNAKSALLMDEEDSKTVELLYDRNTGELSLDSKDQFLTTMEITSKSGMLETHDIAFDGLFDVARNDKIFKMDASGFSDFSFGEVLAHDLSLDDLNSDLDVDGSFFGGGRIESRIVSVPEPHSCGLLLVISVSLLFLGKRR